MANRDNMHKSHEGAGMSELSEFRERLKQTVKKVTCDLPEIDAGMAYAEGLGEQDRLKLIRVLLGEMHQLRNAVLQQK